MTVYRTQCGILSLPEPSPAEYETYEDYLQAHREWEEEWEETAYLHRNCTNDVCYA